MMTASDWILEVPEDKTKLKEAFTLNITDTKIEYLVRDVNHNLRGMTVKVSLNIEYMPIAGIYFNVPHPPRRRVSSKPPTPCPRSTAALPPSDVTNLSILCCRIKLNCSSFHLITKL
jgi:hypothetical protein